MTAIFCACCYKKFNAEPCPICNDTGMFRVKGGRDLNEATSHYFSEVADALRTRTKEINYLLHGWERKRVKDN